jgi:hypothetical protein
MLLVGVLEVYDHVGTLIHHLTGCAKLLTNIVPRVVSLAEATIRDIQLPVLLERGTVTPWRRSFSHFSYASSREVEMCPSHKQPCRDAAEGQS